MITKRNVSFFVISSMGLVLQGQLEIFLRLFLIELLELLTDVGLLELRHLIYPRHLTGFGMLVFFINLSLMEFQVRCLVLFLLVSGKDGFERFWMDSLQKNIQLMLEFSKGPFLFLDFTFYTLMIFSMMLSMILLSMLMILFFILSVVRQLICGKKFNWVLNLNLMYKTLWTGAGNGLLISMLEKLSRFCLIDVIPIFLLM